VQFLNSLLLLGFSQLRILLDQLFDLIVRQILLFAASFGREVIGRNALVDQEVFGNLSTPFRKSPVVPAR
jgi:hypothetical protein